MVTLYLRFDHSLQNKSLVSHLQNDQRALMIQLSCVYLSAILLNLCGTVGSLWTWGSGRMMERQTVLGP